MVKWYQGDPGAQQRHGFGLYPGHHSKGGAVIAPMDRRTRERYEFVPQAILEKSPAFFTARGISFRKDTDDLNDYQVAELALGGELPFALMRHEGTPVDETEVYLPDVIPLDDIPSVLRRILKELDLSVSVVRWWRRSADTPF
jgi:hypothetical protein